MWRQYIDEPLAYGITVSTTGQFSLQVFTLGRNYADVAAVPVSSSQVRYRLLREHNWNPVPSFVPCYVCRGI